MVVMSTKPKLLHGVDLVFVPRIANLFKRYGNRFLMKVLSEEEQKYFEDLPQRKQLSFLAGRIAAKEAVMKATGLGLSNLGYADGLRFTEISLLAVNSQSKPSFSFTGQSQQKLAPILPNHYQLSLSHDGDYALASFTAIAP